MDKGQKKRIKKNKQKQETSPTEDEVDLESAVNEKLEEKEDEDSEDNEKVSYGRNRRVFEWPKLVHKCIEAVSPKNKAFIANFLVNYYKTGDIIGGTASDNPGVNSFSDEGKVMYKAIYDLLYAQMVKLASKEQRANIPARLFNWGSMATAPTLYGYIGEAWTQMAAAQTISAARMATSRIWCKIFKVSEFLLAWQENVTKLVKFSMMVKSSFEQDNNHPILKFYNMNPRSVIEQEHFRKNNGAFNTELKTVVLTMIKHMDANAKNLGFKATIPKIANGKAILDPVVGFFRTWNSHVNNKLVTLKRMLTGSRGGMEKVDWTSSQDENLIEGASFVTLNISL
jgi:hypothetical protein